jgi:hypothetical protein
MRHRELHNEANATMALRRPPTRIEIKPEEALDEFEEVELDIDLLRRFKRRTDLCLYFLSSVHGHSSIRGPALQQGIT